MLPWRFFSPHQTDLSTYIRLIKRAKHEIRPFGNTSIHCHLGQQRSANTVGNHLNNRCKAGGLVRDRDIFLPKLTGLQGMIAKTVALLQQ